MLVNRWLMKPAWVISRPFAKRTFAVDGRVSAAVVQVKSDKSIDLSPPKGTRDFYPEDMQFRNWLFHRWRSIATTHGFEEYDAPVLESESLYTIKSGDEIKTQLFNFVDKGGRNVSLRPEMTPSLARMVISKHTTLQASFPLKWFSIPQCWRYEKQTKGRRREHFQWNMDIWGLPTVDAEAELISALIVTFRSMKLTSHDVGIKISCRKLLASVFNTVGIHDQSFTAMCVIVDKIDKMKPNEVEQCLIDCLLQSHTQHCDSTPSDAITTMLSPESAQKQVQLLLSCLQIKSIPDLKAKLIQICKDHNRTTTHIDEGFYSIERLWQLLSVCSNNNSGEELSNISWLEFDPSIVRGLAYYTGIVFEAFDRGNDLRAICGGGRYDTLAASLSSSGHSSSSPSGVNIAAVGFGFGDAVIYELLKAKNLLPVFPSSRSLASQITVWAPSTSTSVLGEDISNVHRQAIQITSWLRNRQLNELLASSSSNNAMNISGIDCCIGSSNTSAGTDTTNAHPDASKQLKSFLKRANRLQTRIVILCTDREYSESNSYIVRDMSSGKQYIVKYNELDALYSVMDGIFSTRL